MRSAYYTAVFHAGFVFHICRFKVAVSRGSELAVFSVTRDASQKFTAMQACLAPGAVTDMTWMTFNRQAYDDPEDQKPSLHGRWVNQIQNRKVGYHVSFLISHLMI